MKMLLVTRECEKCRESTDHELNTVGLTVECIECGNIESVTISYIEDLMLYDDMD